MVGGGMMSWSCLYFGGEDWDCCWMNEWVNGLAWMVVSVCCYLLWCFLICRWSISHGILLTFCDVSWRFKIVFLQKHLEQAMLCKLKRYLPCSWSLFFVWLVWWFWHLVMVAGLVVFDHWGRCFSVGKGSCMLMLSEEYACFWNCCIHASVILSTKCKAFGPLWRQK